MHVYIKSNAWDERDHGEVLGQGPKAYTEESLSIGQDVRGAG